VDFFAQGNWVRKRNDQDRPVPHQVTGSGQNGTLKAGCHILPTAGLLSSAIQFLHRWIWVTWGYHRHRKWIEVCGRMGGKGRCTTILANLYLSRRSPSGVTDPPAGILGIPRGDCQYRALRAKKLTPNWSLRSPG